MYFLNILYLNIQHLHLVIHSQAMAAYYSAVKNIEKKDVLHNV